MRHLKRHPQLRYRLTLGFAVLAAAAAVLAVLLPWFAQRDPGGTNNQPGSLSYADLTSTGRTVGDLGPGQTSWFGFGWLLVCCCLVILLGIALIRSPRGRIAAFAVTMLLVAVGAVLSLRIVLAAPVIVALAAAGCWSRDITRWIGAMLALSAAVAHVVLLISSGASAQIGAMLPVLSFLAFAAAAIALTAVQNNI